MSEIFMKNSVSILNFQCWVSTTLCELILYDNTINVKGKEVDFEIVISLKTQMRWDISEKGIKSVQIGNYTISANANDLIQLKEDLDGRVTYLGIQNYYETMTLLCDKQQMKVCIVEDRFTKIQFACKCIRKDCVDLDQIHQSIQILYKLQQYKQFLKIFEIYESNTHKYIIMEQMHKQLNLDVTNEEIQIITYELLKIVNLLIENQIDNPKLKFSNIMLDFKGNVKLISFGTATFSNEVEEEQYLHKVGKIMLKLYCIKDNYPYHSLPNLPDKGNEFLLGIMNPNLDYRFKLKDALQHEYIQNILCETSITVKDTLIPKLITEVNWQQMCNSQSTARKTNERQQLKTKQL